LLEKTSETVEDLHKMDNAIKKAERHINEFLEEQKLLKICNYQDLNQKDEQERVLFCKINGAEFENFNKTLQEISKKIFIAAPSTQIFLFVSKAARESIFNIDQNRGTYNQELDNAKQQLTGLFTYDFFPSQIIIDSFISQ
jgi:hypothetical protein